MAPQTVHFTASLCVAVTPHARHIDTGPDLARSSATASASALVAAEALFGMNRSIASSITALVTTECPFSSARRRTPVRAMPLTCSGTCFIRSSASGVQRTRLLGAHVEARHLEARGEEDIAGRGAENVLRVAPERRLVLRAVDADPPQHEQPRIRLARVVEDLLEGLAVEQRLLDLDAHLARHPLAHLEMRLVDLREPGVDDLLVELILLLEAEDLRRLLGEDVDDAVEDGVVEVGIVDGDRLDLLAERASQLDGGHERAERLRAAVDADQDRVALGLARLGDVLDHPDIAVGLAGDAFADRADHAVARAPDSQRADHDQVVLSSRRDP